VQVLTGRLEARLGLQVERPGDGRLIVRAGWGERPFDIFTAALPHLAPREILEVARALGLPVPGNSPEN